MADGKGGGTPRTMRPGVGKGRWQSGAPSRCEERYAYGGFDGSLTTNRRHKSPSLIFWIKSRCALRGHQFPQAFVSTLRIFGSRRQRAFSDWRVVGQSAMSEQDRRSPEGKKRYLLRGRAEGEEKKRASTLLPRNSSLSGDSGHCLPLHLSRPLERIEKERQRELQNKANTSE